MNGFPWTVFLSTTALGVIAAWVPHSIVAIVVAPGAWAIAMYAARTEAANLVCIRFSLKETTHE